MTQSSRDGTTSGSARPTGIQGDGQDPSFKPVLSLWALVLFGVAFVGPTAPFTFFGVGSVESRGHFALVYLIAVIAVSFTAFSYGKMANAFPEAGSTYSYATKALHPVAGYFAGWIMILDYILLPMVCVIIIAATVNKLAPEVSYVALVIASSLIITGINMLGIEITSLATLVFSIVLAGSIAWFLWDAVIALLSGVGQGALFSLRPFYNPSTFSMSAVMSATPVAVLSFLGFDGISTLAEDAKNPRENIGKATALVCFVAGGLFILQTYLGQLLWPDYHTFHPLETAFSDIGMLIGGPKLFYLIALLVIAQAWASGITSQASASRLLYGMARDRRLPNRFFGHLDPKTRTPTYSVFLMGGIACAGGMIFDLGKGAELVNFGAAFGFMAVNLSVIGHYYVRLGRRNGMAIWHNLISPLLGFIICFWIWLSVSHLAMILGVVWTALGVGYLGVITGGFRRPIDLRHEVAESVPESLTVSQPESSPHLD